MNAKLDPTSLSIENLVKVLRASGAREITEEKLRADVEAGLPVNPNGTINLVHCAAWMVRGMSRGD